MLRLDEQYVQVAPSPQAALDIFRGQWSSKLPPPLDTFQAGGAALFDDARIPWLGEHIGGFTNQRILELGPLEGGHTYMLEQADAAEIVAVEANIHAYLKCLIVKELLHLHRVNFLCGDFIAYLREPGPTFDVCLASGVLYHMRNPVELLALLGARCDKHLFLWTHYYDADLLKHNETQQGKHTKSTEAVYDGFKHTLYRYEYQAALAWQGFCGGNAEYSSWMTRGDILDALNHFGFDNLRIGFDHPDHPYGPSFAVLATRSDRT